MIRAEIGLTFILILWVSSAQLYAQTTDFDSEKHPQAPDYGLVENWSALPFRNDAADALPKDEYWISDSLKNVDVFYVHPTMYQKGPYWNASLDMHKINRKVDKYPVRLQASVFNASCRVYAPRYRQAVVKVFYEPSEDGEKSLEFAYQDVKRAFKYFLKYYNHGRPFIIAGHSQGTHHTRRLLQEMIDTTELRKQLVAAYIIGFTVNNEMYQNLNICAHPEETGCYVTWMSYKEGFVPNGSWHKTTQSLNPLTWTLDTAQEIRPEYNSTVVFNPRKIRKRRMAVRIKDLGGQVLWVETKAPWIRLLKDLHVTDYALFWMDIRRNVKTRIDTYWKSK